MTLSLTVILVNLYPVTILLTWISIYLLSVSYPRILYLYLIPLVSTIPSYPKRPSLIYLRDPFPPPLIDPNPLFIPIESNEGTLWTKKCLLPLRTGIHRQSVYPPCLPLSIHIYQTWPLSVMDLLHPS
uniref:Uncharacterized protein n=1 Tax=Cacopsylla melanoneura TaxID=428564 RepID=A0A8D8XFT9_9HEMI